MKLPAHKNASVNLHSFAMTPRPDIPRSSFQRQSTHKTTFDAGYLIPFYADEVLPGDTFNVQCTIFARLATPIFPLMDNMHLSTFFFFVPNRLVHTDWVKLMGEQDNPGDSISFTVPTITSPAGGWAVNSLQDYLGWPTVNSGGAPFGAASTYTCGAYWTRAYNLIWNQWFRSENVQNSVTVDKGPGPDTAANYVLLKRGKRYDYITAALPWPQKGATAVSLPLGTSAVVKTGTAQFTGAQPALIIANAATGAAFTANRALSTGAGNDMAESSAAAAGPSQQGYPQNLYADLSTATSATINQLRLAFQTQKLLERDARGGTRYTEIVRSHFGVISPDARLQRPEYLGGSTTPVLINPTVQTSGTSASGTTTPLGTLGGVGATVARGHGFTQSFTEHGVILGLLCVYADLTYQQGVRRMYNRSTRYDFYFPAFAMIGEQSVLMKELYALGTSGGANDNTVWGYMPRWDEYRYRPSMITGYMRSTAATPLDAWHLAQKFTSAPTLNDTFIQESPPMSRVVAVTGDASGKQFIMDCFINERLARPLPMHSVPGLIDHF